MLIETAIRLLGHVDCRELAERVLAAQESAWYEGPRRHNDYDVHAETQSIILTFCTGWPKVHVSAAKRLGAGQIVLFANDPVFRGYSLDTQRLFVNAAILGPTMR